MRELPASANECAVYEKRGLPWVDYPEIGEKIRATGIKGINPLLDEEEHAELFDTIDPVRMVELVLKGLAKL